MDRAARTQKITPYCCIGPNLTNSTPFSTIVTPNYPPVQSLQYLIETDPAFIAAENGSNYGTYFDGYGSVYSIGGSPPNGTYVYFQSAYSIDSLYTDDCGYVENFTYYLNVNMPLTETGYNMSAIQIIPSNISQTTLDCSSSIVTINENATIITSG